MTAQDEAPRVTSLELALGQWMEANPDIQALEDDRWLVDLQERLLAREDNIADMLRLAGVQFGLFPQIVAEVLADVGLGTPISEEQRTLIRRQFVELMDQLREEDQ